MAKSVLSDSLPKTAGLRRKKRMSFEGVWGNLFLKVSPRKEKHFRVFFSLMNKRMGGLEAPL
jgi:hypothetical protein